jgi:hypothetical protein
MDDKADVAEWAAVKIGSPAVIRHAYDGALTASARLSSFASGRAPRNGPIDRQQEILAVDDLIEFAIHSRRLIENTITKKRARATTMQVVSDDGDRVSIIKIIDVLIHHRNILVARSLGAISRYKPGTDIIDMMKDYEKDIPSTCLLISDRNERFIFKVGDLIETFANEILDPIIDLCAAKTLFLEDLG